jgi:hypothetical protein
LFAPEAYGKHLVYGTRTSESHSAVWKDVA